MKSPARAAALPGDPWIVTRARALVKLRPLVYLLGLVLGLSSAATGSHALFVATATVLLVPAAAALVARASRARRLRLTADGRIALLFAVGMLVAALNTGTNLLYALFALLAAQLLLSVVASSAVLRALFVRRRAPARVRAREPFSIEVSVRNGKLLGAYSLVVEEARPKWLDPKRAAAAFLPRVAGGETSKAAYEAAFLSRGEYVLEGLAVETRFPFGLVARRVELASAQEVLATPVVHPVRPHVLDARATADAPSRRPVSSAETQAAVRSLRDYRPGDHPRSIHWRASARRGALVVKELERSEPRRSLVILDAWLGARTLPPEERAVLLEDAVTLAASLVASLSARGESPGLATRAPEVAFHPPGRTDLAATAPLTTLAKLAPPDDPSLADLAKAARRAAAEGARVFVVTTRPEALAREALAGLDAHDARFLEVAEPGSLHRWLEVGSAPLSLEPAASSVPAGTLGPAGNLGVEASVAAETDAGRSFGRALWAQALFAGGALALASTNPATFTLASANPASLGLLLGVGAFAGLILGLMGKRISRRAELGLDVVAFLFVPIDIFLLQAEMASAFARALLVLQLAKLLGPRTRRDEGTIIVVALVHVAVAASSTVELDFLPAFLGYVVSAAYALALRELRGAPQAPPPAVARVTFGFRALQGALALATLALATAIFVAMPRIGARLLPMSRAPAERISGFSDTIQLDQSGRIRESQKLAFRASVVARGALPAVPLWRGRVLDTYLEGKAWTISPGNDRLARQLTGDGTASFDGSNDRLVRAAIVDIQLEPMRTRCIFAPGVVHRFEPKSATATAILFRDSLGTLTTQQDHLSEIGYRVTCSPELPMPGYGIRNSARDYNETMVGNCLALPAQVDRPKLADYARRAVAAAGVKRGASRLEIARALEDHLGKTFKYTLESKHEWGTERVSEFLFKTKEGHCEIFASALAVLLRAIDIPARVVNGYKGGEYHSWSDSYTVRERHAHSWVEALSSDGWIALDPTPAVNLEEENESGLLATFEDAREWLEIRWFKDVIAFDPGDQATVGKWIKNLIDPSLENVDSWRQAGHEALEHGGKRDLGVIGGVLAILLVLGTAGATVGPRALLLAMGALVARVLGRAGASRSGAGAARELELLVNALEARGVVRRRGETALELAERAEDVLGACARPVAEIVPFYYEARYGGRELTPGEIAAIARAVKSVRDAKLPAGVS